MWGKCAFCREKVRNAGDKKYIHGTGAVISTVPLLKQVGLIRATGNSRIRGRTIKASSSFKHAQITAPYQVKYYYDRLNSEVLNSQLELIFLKLWFMVSQKRFTV